MIWDFQITTTKLRLSVSSLLGEMHVLESLVACAQTLQRPGLAPRMPTGSQHEGLRGEQRVGQLQALGELWLCPEEESQQRETLHDQSHKTRQVLLLFLFFLIFLNCQTSITHKGAHTHVQPLKPSMKALQPLGGKPPATSASHHHSTRGRVSCHVGV